MSQVELDKALFFASQNGGSIVDICKLIVDGADVNYTHRWISDDGEKDSSSHAPHSSVIHGLCRSCESADQSQG